ncbi:MAG TPA: hypothetical protein VEY50_02085 [Lysobacter sp.]|nr:hypothetical protein [Lysobacter sp.]
MHTTVRSLSAALLLLAAPGLAVAQGGKSKAPAVQKKLYCWNENGRKVCGDALPASAVDAERTELSASSGRATAHVGRALTEEERQAEAARQQAEQQAELERQAAHRRLLAMVESYATEDDLRRSFQDRIVLLDESIKSARLGVDALRQSLTSLLRRATEAELAGRPVDKALAANIQRQHADLRLQQTLLTRHIEARAQVDQELNEALQRYRELKQPGTAMPPVAQAAPPPQG